MNDTTNPTIVLSTKRTAAVGDYHGQPTVVVYEMGRMTPGQWYADTIAASTATRISIDAGQNWELTEEETILLIAFAKGVAQLAILEEVRAAETPKHTVRGQTSEDGWPYGTRHDVDCPACLASGASFTASPRSESYWAS